jgi:hypothetical protein
MRKTLLACAAAAMAASVGSEARAWHAQGHLMTAEVAWQTMTPGARCRAAKILRGRIYGLFPQGADLPPADEKMFVTAATWPDRIKQDPRHYRHGNEKPKGLPASRNIGSADKLTHNYWHYVDYPVPDDPAKPPPPVNAQERIVRFVKVLGSTHTSLDLKAYDLAWLIHLVGDVHQPLHTATQYGAAFEHGDDAGDNAVKLSWPDGSVAPNPDNPPRELHGFWDAAPGNDIADLAEAVRRARALPAAAPDKAADLDPAHWIAESRALADGSVYATPIVRGQLGKFVLTEPYRNEAVRITQERVALGGARLGNLLNATLTWPSQACD